jgi:hypothetical protein
MEKNTESFACAKSPEYVVMDVEVEEDKRLVITTDDSDGKAVIRLDIHQVVRLQRFLHRNFLHRNY